LARAARSITLGFIPRAADFCGIRMKSDNLC
jgi:hypothetical protein